MPATTHHRLRRLLRAHSSWLSQRGSACCDRRLFGFTFRSVSSSSPSSRSAPSASARFAPPTVHTSSDYYSLRCHEVGLWQSAFHHPAYSNNFTPSSTVPDFLAAYASIPPSSRLSSVTVQLAGRVTAKRVASNKLVFFDLRGMESRVQVMCSRKEWQGGGRGGGEAAAAESADGSGESSSSSSWDVLRVIRVGDIIGVSGFPGKSKTGELSLIPRSIVPLVPCMHDLPLATAALSVETAASPTPSSSTSSSASSLSSVESRFRQRHLDMLLHPSSLSILRTRALLLATIRSFFTSRRYLEVETPILWPSHGGANARPFVTQSHALSSPLYLRVAPELFLKQLLIGGVERCFEVGRVFRNEGINSSHNPEFTTVEAYEAYSDYEGMMTLTELLMRELVRTVKAARGEDPADLTIALPREEGQAEATRIDFAPPFQRIDILPTLSRILDTQLPDPNDPASVALFLALFATRGIPLPALPHTLPRLLDRLIGHVLEPLCTQPTFLLHHPVSLSPLAHSPSASAPHCERWELFIGGREYVNAYSELNDPQEQRRRMRLAERERLQGDDEAQAVDEEYVRAMEIGLPPTGGWGLGLDRLLMLLTGCRHIREAIWFPIMKKDVQPHPQHRAGEKEEEQAGRLQLHDNAV